ncbi:MAG: hypothetical protein ACOC5T_08165, partial [Elusimicrobiota bacterium]
INISDLSHFEQVYSGHFHTPSQKSNIKFIGSPFQQTFNDTGDSKGYYIFDNGKLEFIEFTNSPKFVKLTTEDELKEEEIKNNIVKFVFLEDYGNVKNDKLIEKVQSLQPHKLHIDYNINVDDSDLTQDGEDFQVDDNSKIIREYIDKKDLPKNIKKDVLKKFVEKLETEMGDL